MSQRSPSLFVTIVFLLSVGSFGIGNCLGQDQGGGGDTGGDTGGFTPGNGGFGQDINLGENAFSLAEEIEIVPSLRYEKGFIGSTANDLNTDGVDSRSMGFIGQRNQDNGGGEYGGGVNNSLTLGSTTNAGRGGQAGGFVGAGGNSLFFEVSRRGVRARLRPLFSQNTQLDSVVFSNQFVSRLDRLPAARQFGKNYEIVVVNKTATITGFVESLDASRRIERQLRFEPGVYRINNRLEIQQ